MNKNVTINNPMKVITGPDTRWFVCQRLGAEIHQWRYTEIQCISDHPEV